MPVRLDRDALLNCVYGFVVFTIDRDRVCKVIHSGRQTNRRNGLNGLYGGVDVMKGRCQNTVQRHPFVAALLFCVHQRTPNVYHLTVLFKKVLNIQRSVGSTVSLNCLS